METKETSFKGLKLSGFLAIFLMLLLIAGGITILVLLQHSPLAIFGGLMILCVSVCLPGFMMVEPNDVRVMLFFGKYKGTVRDNGFFWVNPFYAKKKLTVRARNLDVEPIKVNDKAGNPVMIGLVLVWKIADTYKAMFDIDNRDSATITARMSSYQNFVSVQSDSALRNIASEYAYDNNEIHEEITLRSGGEEITERLEQELNNRLAMAGITVMEARINYLAYAPEIAAVMLRRQQAAAIISAREKIVEGAVGMVKLALDRLAEEQIIELDDDKKASMVSNLLVVLCSDEQTTPVVNAGTLNQ